MAALKTMELRELLQQKVAFMAIALTFRTA
jgi:hypothetical protein